MVLGQENRSYSGYVLILVEENLQASHLAALLKELISRIRVALRDFPRFPFPLAFIFAFELTLQHFLVLWIRLDELVDILWL